MAIQNDIKKWPLYQDGTEHPTRVAITFVGPPEHIFMHYHSPTVWADSLKDHLNMYEFSDYQVDYYDDFGIVRHLCYMPYATPGEL